jgi:hypothetical protein
MPKYPDRTLRIVWRKNRKEVAVDVFAPIILLNLRMVDLRLRKAGLCEIASLVNDGTVWHTAKQAQKVFEDAFEYFDAHPDSIPFSDILVETLPRVLAVFPKIPKRVGVRFETNDSLEA